MSIDKAFKKLIICIAALMVMVVCVVALLDPFYHYHKPLPFLKAVLNDRDYQVVGTIDHFDYDSVVLGTSIAENTNTKQVDDLWNASTIKAIRASGSNADLLYYLNRAFEHQSVKNVFYAVSLDEFVRGLETTYKDMSYYYLFDKNPFNDAEYIFNKDVLFKKIPLELAYSWGVLPYDEKDAYCWYATKVFSKEALISRYEPPKFSDEPLSDEARDNIERNIELLYDCIKGAPSTTFYIYTSPCSAFWWDDRYRTGGLEETCDFFDSIYLRLSELDNVKFYDFAYDSDYTFNLDIYMDTIHFSQYINEDIIDRMAYNEGIKSAGELMSHRASFAEQVRAFSEEEIKEYYPDAQ